MLGKIKYSSFIYLFIYLIMFVLLIKKCDFLNNYCEIWIKIIKFDWLFFQPTLAFQIVFFI